MILPSAAAVTDRPEGEVQGMEQGEIEVVPSPVLIADSPEGGREGGEMETVPKVVTVTLTGVGEGMEGEMHTCSDHKQFIGECGEREEDHASCGH